MSSRLLTLMRKRGGFSPLSLNPTLWALPENSFSDNGVTPAVDNDPAHFVDDASANNNDLTQVNLANRPIYKTATNGYWQFDGSDDNFLLTNPISISYPVSCYAVVDTTNLSTSYRMFLSRTPAAANTPAFYLGAISRNYQPSIYFNGAIKATGAAIQGMQVVRWTITSTNAYTRQNGNAVVDGGPHGGLPAAASWYGINDSVQSSDIDLYEVLLFNGIDLSSDEDNAIFTYLNNKYSVY